MVDISQMFMINHLATAVVQRFINTILYNCLYCFKQNRNLFEMIDFRLRLYTPVKRNGEKNIEEEIERIFEIHIAGPFYALRN